MARDDLDLAALRIAARAVECGGMTEAAGRLRLTQPAVSQAVRRVEAALGTPLFHRDRRPLTPTPAGLVLAARARDLARDAQRLVDAVRDAASLPRRVELRLGLVDTVAGTIGARLVRELMDGATAPRLSVWSGLAPAHRAALVRRAVDAVITCDPMEDVEGIERRPLFREPYVLVVPEALAPELCGRPLGTVLTAHRLVRHSARSFVGRQVERHIRRSGAEPPRVLEFDTSDALIGMVACGVGVAITTPLCLLQGAGSAGGVRALPLPGPGFARELLLATRRGEPDELADRMAAAARRLIAACVLPRLHALIPWLRDERLGAGGPSVEEG